ncbi:TetR/AcrR family transcriptional regulator [Nocardioides salsibiostraticola]
MTTTRERARPLSPEERRTTILESALPLVLEHGRATTTKQIAAAAGVAEGTLFRVFDSKDEIFAAVLAAAFEPGPYLAELDAIDLTLPVEAKLLALTASMQRRFVTIFRLMIALAVDKPPPPPTGPGSPDHQHDEHEEWRREVTARMVAILEPDQSDFRLPLEDVVRMLRLLTFSGSHPHVSEQQPLTPEQIVDVVLHGTKKKDA